MNPSRIGVYALFLVLLTSFAVAADFCNYTTIATTTEFDAVAVSAHTPFVFTGDQSLAGVSAIKANNSFVAYMNLTFRGSPSSFINGSNATSFTSGWFNISHMNISNSSLPTQLLNPLNYTYYNATGYLKIHLSDDAIGWNASNVTIQFQKEFTANVTDLVTQNEGYDYTMSGYGAISYWRITSSSLDARNWMVSYTYNQRQCDVRNACTNTQRVLYAGLALIVLAAIIVSAFALVAMFNGGDMSSAALSAVAVGIVGLGIAVMIGYYIFSAVGASVCIV